MRFVLFVVSLFSLLVVSSVTAFGVTPPSSLVSSTTGSGFVVSQRPSGQQQHTSRRRVDSKLYMASQAKFGIFSPAVYAAKIILGQDKLNKIRGKAISLHSQSITDFSEWVGAYHMRTRLIQKAKKNGDTLGFLV